MGHLPLEVHVSEAWSRYEESNQEAGDLNAQFMVMAIEAQRAEDRGDIERAKHLDAQAKELLDRCRDAIAVMIEAEAFLQDVGVQLNPPCSVQND